MKLRFDHPAWHRLGPLAVRKWLTIYLRTCTVDLAGDRQAWAWLESGRPCIGATWHCHLLAPLFFFSHLRQGRRYYAPFLPTVLMASPSRDGEFIAAVARGLGFIVCMGSRQKGGVKALHDMAGYIRRGHRAALVADGSRGPARVAQKGVLFLAREAGVPIIPMAVACSRKITLNTWDRFELPLPFSRLTVLAGPPLQVIRQHRGPSLEAVRLELEARLNILCHAKV